MPEFDQSEFLENFNREYEQSLQDTEVIEDVEDNGSELMNDVPDDEVLEDEEVNLEEGEASEVEEEVALDPNAESEAKRNTAFAQLRRERDEAKRVADWLSQVAEQNGTTPEEMMKNYEQVNLQKQADEKGVPVDLLQRMKALEEENATIKNMTFAERFNADVERTVETYGASPEEIDQTFQYAQQQGLIDIVKQGGLTFEALHKMAHLDTITEKKVQQALQQNLSSKKKRQQEAPIPNGSGAVETGLSIEDRAKADAKRFIEDGTF